MRKSAKFLLGGAGVIVAAAAATAGYIYWTKAISPQHVTRPTDSKMFAGDRAKLLEIGTTRHGDTSLSPIGRSCDTCHLEENSYNETFNRPFLHYVQSVRFKTGLDQIRRRNGAVLHDLGHGGPSAGLGLRSARRLDGLGP